MSRATQISRVVFALLVVLTFGAFFVAQKLKHADPLVYSVSVKRYISPNSDGIDDKGRIRFRLKKADYVTVEVIDGTGTTVRTLADDHRLSAGPHTFYWNGRFRGTNIAGHKQRGVPVADGAYRARITLRTNGRTFVPDQFFVVDTAPPALSANVLGTHSRSILRARTPVKVTFAGVEARKRVTFFVYRVLGQAVVGRPVAAFPNVRGKSYGIWKQDVGQFSERRPQRGQRADPCSDRLTTRGTARPAPTSAYVVVVQGCDAAGNLGSSSRTAVPRAGSTRGRAGVTLTGTQIEPAMATIAAGTRAAFAVSPPVGGYRYRLALAGGKTVASGKARGPSLGVDVPDNATAGLYTLRITARKPVRGDSGRAMTPVAVSAHRRALLVVEPSIAWQATNPVDANGDGFPDAWPDLPDGVETTIATDRPLARGAGPSGFASTEGALAGYLATAHPDLPAAYTTDYSLAADPTAALRGVHALLFAGDERWITPQLGIALRAFVERGGKVAFFAPDAFRRTATILAASGQMTGPSDRRQRDIFGESVQSVHEAPAPVVPFVDKLGLLRGLTGEFSEFEQSRQRASGSDLLTSAGRVQTAPAFIAYGLGSGTVIRVGAGGWLNQLRAGDANIAYSTNAIIAELQK